MSYVQAGDLCRVKINDGFDLATQRGRNYVGRIVALEADELVTVLECYDPYDPIDSYEVIATRMATGQAIRISRDALVVVSEREDRS